MLHRRINTPGSYFKQSGEFRIAAPFLMLIGGSIIGGIAGVIYAYAIRWIPIIILNFFLTILFGLGIGLVVAFFGRVGHARNAILRFCIGLLVALFSLYVSWVAWIAAMGQSWVTDPSELWSRIRLINLLGAWSFGGNNVTGTALWIIWILEAAIVIGFCLFIACTKEVYCERCGQWSKNSGSLGPFKEVNDAALKNLLESGDFTPLRDLHPAESPGVNHTTLEISHCEECKELHTVEVNAVTVTQDKKGKEEKKSKTLVKNLIIPPDVSLEILTKFAPEPAKTGESDPSD